ncbi:putative transmembrane protein [Toxoplasma gondii RUB]|uniref:Putative transmembrane protein n=1 Tax=Toxoplasma gondii RUB TaxID=935652 RepID=A0A086LRV6_TOXGO|nr:putative transmembrane protein [Toxoplasma gondii RUB]
MRVRLALPLTLVSCVGTVSPPFHDAATSASALPTFTSPWALERVSDYRPVQITPGDLPFLLKTSILEPPEATVAAVAIKETLKREALIKKRREWFQGLKKALFRLPFKRLRRRLMRRMEASRTATASFKALMGHGVRTAALGGYYGFGGLLSAIALPFRAIGYTVASGFHALVDSPQRFHNIRMALLRTEKEEAEKFLNTELRQAQESDRVMTLIEKLTNAILTQVLPPEQLRIDLRAADLQSLRDQVSVLYSRYKEAVKPNPILRAMAQGTTAQSFMGRMRNRLSYRRTVRKNAEAHVFTAFVNAVNQASLSADGRTKAVNTRVETAAALIDLFFQLCDHEERGMMRATELFLQVNKKYLEEETVAQISSSLASAVVAQRYEMAALLQRLSERDGKLLSPDAIRRACRGSDKYVDAAAARAGFPTALDTRLDYFVYIYESRDQDPELELQRCVSAENVYRLVGQKNFFVPGNENVDQQLTFEIGDFRLVKGSFLLSKIEDPTTAKRRLLHAVGGYLYNMLDSESVKHLVTETLLEMNYIPLTPIPEKTTWSVTWRRRIAKELVIAPSCVVAALSSRVDPRDLLNMEGLPDEEWKELLEPCGYALAPRSRFQRLTGRNKKDNFIRILRRMRVNSGTFTGTRPIHDAYWNALKVYLGGSDAPVHADGMPQEFFREDPTFAFLNSVFQKTVEESGVRAFYEDAAGAGIGPPALVPLQIQPVSTTEQYSPSNAPEAWRLAMRDQFRKLTSSPNRIYLVVEDAVRIRACKALKRLKRRDQLDAAIVNEVLRYFGLQGPSPPIDSLICAAAPVNAQAALGRPFATEAFATRGSAPDGSLEDPMAVFRIFIERTLMQLDGGAQLPFITRFLIEGHSQLFQIHSLIAKVNVETMRGYEADKLLKLAQAGANSDFGTVLESMKPVFTRMFDVDIIGLRHKNGADCFRFGDPWVQTGGWSAKNSYVESSVGITFAAPSSVSREDCIPGTRDGQTFSDAVTSAVHQWLSQGFSNILFNAAVDEQEVQPAETAELIRDTHGAFQALGDTARTVFQDMLRIQRNPALISRAREFLQKFFADPLKPPPVGTTRLLMSKAIALEGKDGLFDGFHSNSLVQMIWEKKDEQVNTPAETEDPIELAFKFSLFARNMSSRRSISLPLRYTSPFPLASEQQIKRHGAVHQFFYNRWKALPGSIMFFVTIGSFSCLMGGITAPLCAGIFFNFAPFYSSQLIGVIGLLAGSTISLVKLFKWYVYSTAQLAVQHMLWGALQVVVGSATMELIGDRPLGQKSTNADTERLTAIEEMSMPLLQPSTDSTSSMDETKAPQESLELR